MSGRKRAYRYEVIGHGGAGTKAIGDSPTMIDWKYLGREYTWTIYDFKVGEVVGFITGRYVGFITGRYMDRGYVEDGQYQSDAERSAAA